MWNDKIRRVVTVSADILCDVAGVCIYVQVNYRVWSEVSGKSHTTQVV